MTDKSLKEVLQELSEQSDSSGGLNLRRLETELRSRNYKIDETYLAILRGLLQNTEDLKIANDLDLGKQTVSNGKTKIRKHLNTLLKEKDITPPGRKKDHEYINKLNEAGSQLLGSKKKSLVELIIFVCKVAYWDICQQTLLDISRVKKVWNSGLQRKLKQQIETIAASQELTVEQAKTTLKCFPQSEFAKELNKVITEKLKELIINEETVTIIPNRITHRTSWYLKQTIYELRDHAKELANIYESKLVEEVESYGKIEQYLKDIAKNPLETVFEEDFTYKDIYVTLEVQAIKKDTSEIDQYKTAEDIENWAKKYLLHNEKSDRVLFIQGGPGRGKSVFCRMFADWIREHLHPIWTPILIRLRDIQAFSNNLDETLQTTLNIWEFSRHDSWLSDSNTRFLFILDGFDELLLERGVNNNLKQFLDQVGQFQRSCWRNSNLGHRVLITGRPLVLYGIEKLMPINFECVKIILMKSYIQEKWFQKWQNFAYKNSELEASKTQALRKFLSNQDCPQEVQELAKEPLLLYMLAAMHRDGKLKPKMFQNSIKGGAKVLIYQEAIDWVLNKQRSDKGRNLNLKIGEIKDLRSVLAEAGLCVVQSGREYTAISHIEHRLDIKKDEGAKAILVKARRQSANQQDAEKGLKIPLAVFYLKSVPDADNSVEFVHKSFGEFLCAERMVKTFVEWTIKIENDRNKPYKVKNDELQSKIYDLLGYGHLTSEIVEYVMALLEQAYKNGKIDLVILFVRLNDFYLCWSDGKFIEATVDTLPQEKARQLQKDKIERGQREVDIYTGLNILILLLELHRYGQREGNEKLKDQLAFHPCGTPDTEDFVNTRLLRIIGYSECLGSLTFSIQLGKWLREADLRKADFSNANLSNVDFTEADLREANLSNSNLKKADFSNANLRETNFTEAYLREANLSYANLITHLPHVKM